jgi:arylsulfatase A-like enzyme
VLPSLGRPVVVHYPDLRLRCLPDILAEQGYATYFFHNAPDLRRERMGAFLRDNGVQHPFALDDGLADPVRDETALWGFGRTLQDDVFFTRVFDRLDADRAAGVFGDSPESPVFVTVKPGSHHLWFDHVPARERRVYREPRNQEEWFALSLNTSDRYLATFFEELSRRPGARDALVVLLGDHGFPAGEHGIHRHTVGAWEETFRTPLVIWSPGWLPPRRIVDRAHSQLDIMPTVLDLLGVPAQTHLAGESIVARKPGTAAPELLLQPYDGRHLVSLQFPHKLVLRLDTGRERLFDLAADPRETRDLLGDPVEPGAPAIAARLRPALREFFDNQVRLRVNGFVPP